MKGSGNPATVTGAGEQCPKCNLGTMQRANVRGHRENLLFLVGASILRCSSCEIRRAAWSNFRIPLNSDETDNTYVIVFATVSCGILICTAIALFMLRRAHRWPF
jgi:LSD1 subclass zinc finger protein